MSTSATAPVAGVAAVRSEPQRLELQWDDGTRGHFDHTWLRDNCQCPACLHPTSGQKLIDTHSIPLGIQPAGVHVDAESTTVIVDWDGDAEPLSHLSSRPGRAAAGGRRGGSEHRSVFHSAWLKAQHDGSTGARRGSVGVRVSRAGSPRPPTAPEEELWAAADWAEAGDGPEETEEAAEAAEAAETAETAETGKTGGRPTPTVAFDDLMDVEGGGGLRALLTSLRRHGFAVVENAPDSMEETRLAAERVGFVRRTLYGEMWDTAPKDEEEVNDTAYTNDALLPHTDCTYIEDPPALQVFNCVQASPHGGSTLLVDGFRVAADLQRDDSEAYDFLCKTPIPYHCIEEGWNLRAEYPVFTRHPKRRRGEGPPGGQQGGGSGGRADAGVGLRAIRFNEYDRRPQMPGLEGDELALFYKYWRELSGRLRDEKYLHRVLLKTGDMIFIDNWRVLHGRDAFLGHRNLIGCYIGNDEFESALRLHLP